MLTAESRRLGQAAVTKKLTDYTVQMGGPLKKDKAFFFASVQRYSAKTDPTGPVANSTDISPRFNMKFTLQPSPTDTVIARHAVRLVQRHGPRRFLAGLAGDRSPDRRRGRARVGVELPVAGRSSARARFLEAKFTGYDGYYNLDPVDPSPFTYDGDTDEYSCGGGGGLYYDDRSRNQVQVSLTKYAEKFGRHALKFGLEIERSHVRMPVPAVRAGRLLHPSLRRRAVLPDQLRLRRPGRQPPHVRVTRRISGQPGS